MITYQTTKTKKTYILPEGKELTADWERKLLYRNSMREAALATPEMLQATEAAYEAYTWAVMARRP